LILINLLFNWLFYYFYFIICYFN